ncbi:MAG: L-aspartate oxidase [Clostridiales bacterium]|nr:L-aspartate oxidase [Clostridiales bacterium]
MSLINRKYDVVIVGAGVAGLNCALNLPREKSALIICKNSPRESDSYLAQGGICVLRGDSDFDEYYNDTLRAGHGENNPDAVKCMINGSREIIGDLINLGVDFAKNADGTLVYTREGGHTSPRICYHEDSTGNEITTSLMRGVQKLKNVQIAPNVVMLDIIEDGEKCVGIVVYDKAEMVVKKVYADYTVLATGGIGGAFSNSTNYRTVSGDALAICLRHGVRVDHINYIQTHPTTLYSKKRGRRFLISESVRGEGAHLLDKNFNRFTDELKPRDVVTKAVAEQMKKDGTDFVWLDMRPIPREETESHFPQIVAKCAEEGYDVFTQPIPVVPAIHYFMGGVYSDLNGRTVLPRLYAVGETCCNGVHGKNRLASNSLLESLLFAKRAALDIAANYSALNLADAKKIPVDGEKYKDVKKLLNQYKKDVQYAVCLADCGEDVNEKFKGIKG